MFRTQVLILIRINFLSSFKQIYLITSRILIGNNGLHYLGEGLVQICKEDLTIFTQGLN